MDQTESRRDGWLTVLFTLLILAGLVVLVLGVWLAWTRQQYTLLGLGVLAVAVPASAYALAGGGTGGAQAGDAGMAQQLQELRRLLESINERMLISDQAKRIAFRQKDRDALRDAIREDIQREDYEAAAALIDEMTNTYGYAEEAEQFRQQLLDVQRRKREAVLQQATERIDAICERHDWDQAHHEVARLKRLYPDHPGINDLDKRIEQAKERHKYELEREFLQAAERDDIERAMELMTELDNYLTPEEAQPYMETARGVVGKKRQNLGVRFKMAVQDRDWINALSVGEQIIQEFPNSTFAKEVRGMLDTLRQRANEQRQASTQQEQSV